MTGTLTLVATPIGNLGDISSRAAEALKSADLVVCEDTRHSGRLLAHLGISKPMLALFAGKERSRSAAVLERLKSGQNVALITDAGTPAIQDPGFLLVRQSVENRIPVTAVPGPCAAIMALTLSGLPTDRFLFEGFLPVKTGARRRRIQSWKDFAGSVVVYESPYKIQRTLGDVQAVLGDVRVAVMRELTKKFEQVLRGPVSHMIAHFETHRPQGEFVIVIQPETQTPKSGPPPANAEDQDN